MLSALSTRLALVERTLEQHEYILQEIKHQLQGQERDEHSTLFDTEIHSIRQSSAEIVAKVICNSTRIFELQAQIQKNADELNDLRNKIVWSGCYGLPNTRKEPKDASIESNQQHGCDNQMSSAYIPADHTTPEVYDCDLESQRFVAGTTEDHSQTASSIVNTSSMYNASQSVDIINQSTFQPSHPSVNSFNAFISPVTNQFSFAFQSYADSVRNNSPETVALTEGRGGERMAQGSVLIDVESVPDQVRTIQGAILVDESFPARARTMQGTVLTDESIPAQTRTMQEPVLTDESVPTCVRAMQGTLLTGIQSFPAPLQYPTCEVVSASDNVTFYTERCRSLEDQLLKRDATIKELSTNNEILANKEKDFMKKEEWYEHKMKLLKQDKRRRGETIGKLLRCIDDMKDQGRVDENKVTDGRLVLASALKSRTWSMEDRISAAIESMEIERAVQRSSAAIEGTYATTAALTLTATDGRHDVTSYQHGLPTEPRSN